MLEDTIFSRIDKLPKRYYRHTFRDSAKILKSVPTIAANKIKSYKRILSSAKPFYVDGIQVSGIRAKYSGYSLVKIGDALSTTAKYICNKHGVRMAKVVQKMGSEMKDVDVIFTGYKSYYTLTTQYKVTEPVILPCSYEIYWRGRADTRSMTFNIGVFDDRYKPDTEYPVSGAENVVLDLRASWRQGITAYPKEPPADVSMGYSYKLYGSIAYGGKVYMMPNFEIIMSYSFKNNTSGETLKITKYGIPVGVVYGDLQHVSMFNYNASIPDTEIGPGQRTSGQVAITLPSWAYGHVFIALAFNIYNVTGGENLLKYSGGPFLELDLFRVRLP